MSRKGIPVSMISSEWTDQAMAFLLDATDYRNRASLLTPAVLALLAVTVASMERDSDISPEDELLVRGRAILKDYGRRNPASQVGRND